MRLTDTDREIRSLLHVDMDKPDRIPALWQVRHHLSPLGYWTLFRSVWTGSESLSLDRSVFLLVSRMLTYHSGMRDAFMIAGERTALAKMPDEFTIYRGSAESNMHGWSWTSSPEVAAFFARRSAADEGIVYEGIVKRDDVIAYLRTRDEEEYVVHPNKVVYDNAVPIECDDMNDSRFLFWAVQTGQLEIPYVIPMGEEERYKKIVDEKCGRLAKFGLTSLVQKERDRLSNAHIIPIPAKQLLGADE